jgi:hypothetical protein
MGFSCCHPVSLFSDWLGLQAELSPKELAVSFDLPVALHKEWLKASRDLPFLTSTPSKVLMSVSSAIGDSLADLDREISSAKPVVSQGSLPPAMAAAPVTQSGVSV